MKNAIFLIVLALSPLFGASYNVVEDKCDLKILTPSLATRTTAKIRLENGLEAYLISDPGCHESGAALAVHVGSWDDPSDAPGLAHFVEHMLFMGTEKYPNEKEYHRFLDEHGGRNNAFTANDRTVYMFSVDSSAFADTLDRFSQFFIAPLFNPSCLARECHAVDQEFSKNIPLDAWRVMHVKKELGNPEHPIHRFTIGNCKTLSGVPRETVQAWYQSHYSANLMHLAVISKLPLEELQELVAKTFSPIKNKNLKVSRFESSLFPADLASKLLVIAPKQQVQKLEISWEIPPTLIQEKQFKVDSLLKYVLSHEGEGSLITRLKKEGLASALHAETDHLGYGQGLFNLNIALTSKGVENIHGVIKICFEALDSYRKSGIPSYFFDEIKEIEKLAYSYQMREETFDFVTELAYCLIDEPLETFPQMTLMPTKYDPKKIAELISHLKPESAHYTLIAPTDLAKVKCDKKEEWLGASYTVIPIKEEQIKEWQCDPIKKEIALPLPNPFIPKHLKLVSEKKTENHQMIPLATLIAENESGKAYHATDDRFFVPLISWHFSLHSPLIHDDDAVSKVLADLYARNFEKRMKQISYQAELAGLNYSLTPFAGGLNLTMKGYSEKAGDLLLTLLKEMSQFKPTKEEFALHKEEFEREYHNRATKTPVIEANELMSSILYKDFAASLAKLEAIKEIDFAKYNHFALDMMRRGFLEATFFGNMSEDQAKSLFAEIQKVMALVPFPPSEHYQRQIAIFSDAEDPSYVVKKSKLQGNALMLVVDADAYTPKRKAALEIIAKGLEEPFFTELRTRQKTAYLVSNWEQEIENHLYAFFVIQSSSHDTRDLLARFELFFETSLSDLESTVLPQARFDSIKSACIEAQKNSCENAHETGKLLHTLAFEKDGNFSLLEERIKGLQELTYTEFVEFTKKLLGKENHKRVAVCIDGTIEKDKSLSYHRHSTPTKIRKEFSYKGKKETFISDR